MIREFPPHVVLCRQYGCDMWCLQSETRIALRNRMEKFTFGSSAKLIETLEQLEDDEDAAAVAAGDQLVALYSLAVDG